MLSAQDRNPRLGKCHATLESTNKTTSYTMLYPVLFQEMPASAEP